MPSETSALRCSTGSESENETGTDDGSARTGKSALAEPGRIDECSLVGANLVSNSPVRGGGCPGGGARGRRVKVLYIPAVVAWLPSATAPALRYAWFHGHVRSDHSVRRGAGSEGSAGLQTGTRAGGPLSRTAERPGTPVSRPVPAALRAAEGRIANRPGGTPWSKFLSVQVDAEERVIARISVASARCGAPCVPAEAGVPSRFSRLIRRTASRARPSRA